MNCLVSEGNNIFKTANLHSIMHYLIYLPTGRFKMNHTWRKQYGKLSDMSGIRYGFKKRNECSLSKRLLKYRIFPGFSVTQRQKTKKSISIQEDLCFPTQKASMLCAWELLITCYCLGVIHLGYSQSTSWMPALPLTYLSSFSQADLLFPPPDGSFLFQILDQHRDGKGRS